MRIVFVTTSYPRTADDPSGHFVRASARALARQGHDVHVVAPGGSPFEAPRRRGDLMLHRAGGGSLFAWPGALARARAAPLRLAALAPFAFGVHRRLRALGPVDHAIAHWIVPSGWPLALGVRSRSLEVVAHGADVRALLGAPRRLRAAVLRELLARGASFTFAARALLESLESSLDAHLSSSLLARARVEPPSLELPDVTARATELRASVELAPGERLAVVVCRLVPSKRVALALEALHDVSGARLVVVGDGPDRVALERSAGSTARFVGRKRRREALAWIAAADVLVHPSGVEAAPSVIREARSLGVPVVACASGDVAAWAAHDAGIEVVEASAAAIRRAVTRRLDLHAGTGG